MQIQLFIKWQILAPSGTCQSILVSVLGYKVRSTWNGLRYEIQGIYFVSPDYYSRLDRFLTAELYPKFHASLSQWGFPPGGEDRGEGGLGIRKGPPRDGEGGGTNYYFSSWRVPFASFKSYKLFGSFWTIVLQPVQEFEGHHVYKRSFQ
jgi:hypothetical protein